jgi:hypothetical protein
VGLHLITDNGNILPLAIHFDGSKILPDTWDKYQDRLQHLLVTYRWQLVFFGLGTLIAYGFHAFTLTLNLDDWQAYANPGALNETIVSHGRWMATLQFQLTNNLFAPAFLIFLYVFFYLLSAAILIKVVGINDKAAIFFIIGAIIFHPFHADAISFDTIHHHPGVLTAAVSAYFATVAMNHVFARQRIGLAILYTAVSAFLLSLAISFYQPTIYVFTVILGAHILNDIFSNRENATIKNIGIRIVFIIALAALGGFLWTIGVRISLIVYNVEPLAPESTYSANFIASFDDLRTTTSRFVTFFSHYLFRPQLLMPAVVKYIFLIMLLSFAIIGWRAAVKRSVIHATLVILGLLLLLVIPWSIGLIRLPDNTYNSRALTGNIFVYGIIIGIVLQHATYKYLRRGLLVLLWVLISIFLFQNSSASLVLHTNNQRDIAIANRILDRVESHPDFHFLLTPPQPVEVVVIGELPLRFVRPFTHVRTPPPMHFSALHCGVFSCQPSRLSALLTLYQTSNVNYPVAGIPFSLLPPEETVIVSAIMATMEPWPSPDSIYITDQGLLVIMLSEQ